MAQVDTGRIIAEKRGEKGMTQQQLAKKAGISRQAIGNIERGISMPTPETRYKIADALGILMRDLDEIPAHCVGNMGYHRGQAYAVADDILNCEDSERYGQCSRHPKQFILALQSAMAASRTDEDVMRMSEAVDRLSYEYWMETEKKVLYSREDQNAFLFGYSHEKALSGRRVTRKYEEEKGNRE